MNKALRKAIMRRSYLRNTALKSRASSDWTRYKKQRNLVTNLNKEAKRTHFANAAFEPDSKSFWKACRPFFTKDNASNKKTVLVENDSIVSNDKDVASIFNEYFCNITDTLCIQKWEPSHTFITYDCSPVLKAINKFKSHPSIVMIKARQSYSEPFTFKDVNPEEVFKTIMQLDSLKKTSGNIPITILRMTAREISTPLSKCFNNSLKAETFPSELKLAEIVPVHKKESTTDKSNFRPISLLPAISKIYERLVYKQLTSFIESKLSKYLCGFRKGYSTEHCLLNLVHSWKRVLAKSGKVGAVLMDLSKAFDVLPHDLLIAKLHAYGLGHKSLNFIYSYLTSRKMRVRIGAVFSHWLLVKLGVPQGSILGPLLFNIFLNDIFLCEISSEIANFADDNTLSANGSSMCEVIESLHKDIPVIIDWFNFNEMVVNAAKFQFLAVGCDAIQNIVADGHTITSSERVKLLGVTIDNKLSFTPHIKQLCAKANQKISALFRIRSYLNVKKALAIYNAHIMSSFRYCPLIWMFCSKSAYNQIASTQTRAMRAIYQDFKTPSSDIINAYHGENAHTYSLRQLATEVYKSVYKLNPSFMWDYFTTKLGVTNLRKGNLLNLPSKEECSKDSFIFRGILLWNNLPAVIKSSSSLLEFKTALKNQQQLYCQCKICAS